MQLTNHNGFGEIDRSNPGRPIKNGRQLQNTVAGCLNLSEEDFTRLENNRRGQDYRHGPLLDSPLHNSEI